MKRAIRSWLMVSLVGLVLLPLLACDTIYDEGAIEKFTEIRGTVRIPGALSPLLPAAAAAGAQVQGGEPGNCWDTPHVLPDIIADEPALVIKGSITPQYAGSACDDAATVWYQFQVNKKASLTMHVDWENAGVDGFVPALYSRDAGSGGGVDFITWDLTGVAPIDITLVADPSKEYVLRFLKWYESGHSTAYEISLSAISGTVVGQIMVGAYPDADPTVVVPGAYAAESDPEGAAAAGDLKFPVGGTTVSDFMVDGLTGDLTGWFDGLLVPVKKCSADADCDCGEPGAFINGVVCSPTTCNTEQGYCQYWVFAFADNDGGNTLNFSTMGPPTSADFVMTETVPVPGGRVDFGKGWILHTMSELRIDGEVFDADFDGVFDGDNNGDGIEDDNCPTTYNTDQADADGDGVGDMCDNCVDDVNPDQANWDGMGPGDACNGFLDEDGDDVEYRADDEDDTGDNCPVVANPYQDDLDNDGLGDECDDDMDADTVPNETDNCPGAGNTDQADADGDGVGDACDNCRGNMSTCLAANPVAGEVFDSPRDEWDAAWMACENTTTVACGECGGLLTNCLDLACSDCRPGAENCYAHANCTEAEVAECEANLGSCIAKCDRYPEDLEQNQEDCYKACDSDRNKCIDRGPCSRKKFDGCMTCQDVCEGQCAGYDGFCTSQCATCAGESCDVGNGNQDDNDGDGVGDACDLDDDDDGIADSDEASSLCQMVPNGDSDMDGDTIPDECDVCPTQFDAGQADEDADGVGDLCDNCLGVGNPDQADSDGDMAGDACDDDVDGDGVDNAGDNCATVANPKPACAANEDCAGASGICDVVAGTCNGQLDTDADGLGDECDSCPAASNAGQADRDGDGLGDVCDNCPAVANEDQANSNPALTFAECVGPFDCGSGFSCITGECVPRCDGDFVCPAGYMCQGTTCAPDPLADFDNVGDACDPDDDGDRVCDPGVTAAGCSGSDNCPMNFNPNQRDADRNGLGDVCDLDGDGDGVYDEGDNCPAIENADQADADGDGIGDECDACQNVADNGVDTDGDGMGDACDTCPDNADVLDGDNNPINTDGDRLPDACDSDDDNDGAADSADNCPIMANNGQEDGDADGVGDVCDNCPAAANPDQGDMNDNGVGDACDADADGDGVDSVDDNCPMIANPLTACIDDSECVGAGTCDVGGTDLCTAQLDSDGNGVGDACEVGGEVITDFFEQEPNSLYAGAAHDLRPDGLIKLGYDYVIHGSLDEADGSGSDAAEDFFLLEFEQAGTVMIAFDWQNDAADYDLIMWHEDPPGSGSLSGGIAGYMGAYLNLPEVAILEVEPGRMYAINASGYEGGGGLSESHTRHEHHAHDVHDDFSGRRVDGRIGAESSIVKFGRPDSGGRLPEGAELRRCVFRQVVDSGVHDLLVEPAHDGDEHAEASHHKERGQAARDPDFHDGPNDFPIEGAAAVEPVTLARTRLGRIGQHDEQADECGDERRETCARHVHAREGAHAEDEAVV